MKAASTLFAICVLVLTLLGLVMQYSVSEPGESWRFLSRQTLGCGLGIVLAAGLAFLTPYAWLHRFAWVMLGVAILMLIVVLLPLKDFCHKANGAQRWFKVFGVQFQPSDFAKLALLLALARYAAEARTHMGTFTRGVLVPGALIGPVLGLIFVEPDWGTALMLGAVCGVVLLVAGVKWRYFVPPVILGLVAVGCLLAYDPTRFDRVYSYLHVEETRLDTGHQVWQSWTALGAGGLTGVGFNRSTQKRLVPEERTDFIFAIIGEEFGYVGAVGVTLLYMILFCCGWYIAWNAPDPFGTFLATGITFLITLQALFNIAVVSGAIPNKGLSLPFISYGGSNLLMLLISAGALLRVARAAVEPAREESAVAAFTNLPLSRLA
jgi:cell division protein FtsW